VPLEDVCDWICCIGVFGVVGGAGDSGVCAMDVEGSAVAGGREWSNTE